MERQTIWEAPFTTSLTYFDSLIGDARTRSTFAETVKGIRGVGARQVGRLGAAQRPETGQDHAYPRPPAPAGDGDDGGDPGGLSEGARFVSRENCRTPRRLATTRGVMSGSQPRRVDSLS